MNKPINKKLAFISLSTVLLNKATSSYQQNTEKQKKTRSLYRKVSTELGELIIIIIIILIVIDRKKPLSSFSLSGPFDGRFICSQRRKFRGEKLEIRNIFENIDVDRLQWLVAPVDDKERGRGQSLQCRLKNIF